MQFLQEKDKVQQESEKDSDSACESSSCKETRNCFRKSKEGVDYQSLDGQPAHLFFMIAAPEGGAQTHLDALAKLSGILMDDNVREALLHAETPDEVLAIIDKADDEAPNEDEEATVDPGVDDKEASEMNRTY